MTHDDQDPAGEDALITAILYRFRAQRAAEFNYVAHVPFSGGVRESRIGVKLIPEALFSDDRNGLFLVIEGRGSYSWSGIEPLSPAKLMTVGVRPLDLAVKLAHTLNALVARLNSSVSQISTDRSMKEISYDRTA